MCIAAAIAEKNCALRQRCTKGDTGSGDVNVRLTETEVRDIRALNSAFEDFVLVLNVGGVVDLAPVAEVATVLLMSQLGSAAGDAVADVLLGTSYPSGKLTTTWAAVTDDPSTEGFGGRACTGRATMSQCRAVCKICGRFLPPSTIRRIRIR